jgi:hypothetical protein
VYTKTSKKFNFTWNTTLKILYINIKYEVQFLVSMKLFDEKVNNYCKTLEEYLKKWSNPLIKFDVFHG